MKTASHGFMSFIMALLLWTLPSLSFATGAERIQGMSSMEVLELVDSKSLHKDIPAESCFVEYQKLRRKTIIRTVAAPVIGFAAVYALAYAGGFALGTSGNGGSGSLAGVFVGVILGAYVGMITYAINQSFSIIRLVKVHNYIKLIEQAYDGSGKKLSRIAKKLGTDVNFVAGSIKEMNESGRLCDGSLRGRSRSSKLKKRLARKKDIVRHLKNLL